MCALERFTENKILLSLIEGEEWALDKLYLKHVQSLYAFVLKTAKSPSLSEDVVQDVFVKIWENRSQIDPDKPFKPYLYTIARNHLLNLLKRAQHETVILQEIKRYTPFAENVTDLATEYKESHTILQHALNQLGPKCREVFVRCKLDGLSYKKVAEEMGITEGTVNSQIVKATKAIKKHFSVRNISILLFALFN